MGEGTLSCLTALLVLNNCDPSQSPTPGHMQHTGTLKTMANGALVKVWEVQQTRWMDINNASIMMKRLRNKDGFIRQPALWLITSTYKVCPTEQKQNNLSSVKVKFIYQHRDLCTVVKICSNNILHSRGPNADNWTHTRTLKGNLTVFLSDRLKHWLGSACWNLWLHKS
jgi:hypothetical protein